jgi:hypothetical protein
MLVAAAIILGGVALITLANARRATSAAPAPKRQASPAPRHEPARRAASAAE